MSIKLSETDTSDLIRSSLVAFEERLLEKPPLHGSQCVEEMRTLDGILSNSRQLHKSLPQSLSLLALTEQCCHLIWLTASPYPKLNRKLIQILVSLERVDAVCVEKSLHKRVNWNRDSTTCDEIAVWSYILETSPVCRALLRQHLHALLEVVVYNMDRVLNDLALEWTMLRQDQLHTLTKITLQVMQHLSGDMAAMVSGDEDGQQPALSQQLLQLMLTIVRETYIPKECVLLAGTAICLIIHTGCYTPEKQSKAFFHIYFTLSDPTNTDLSCITNPSTPLTDHSFKLQSPPTMGHLSLLNGLLSSATPRLLRLPLQFPEKTKLLLEWLFLSICDMTPLTQHQYHTFKMLSTWFSKMPKLSMGESGMEVCCVFEEGSDIVERALAVIWTHMDSPVEGVNECVMDSFKSLLALSQVEDDDDKNSGHSLVESLLPRILAMSWQVKGKHNLLAGLLQYVSIATVLRENPMMLTSMLDCLTTNYLASPATHLFKSVLQQITVHPNKLELWKEHCLPCLLSALTSQNNLVRHNIGHHWLPWSLKLLPDGLEMLLSNLQQGLQSSKKLTKPLYLHAVVVVLKVAKNSHQLKDMPLDLLSEALSHNESHIRQDAFTLLCSSTKKAEAISACEISLLKRHLLTSMSVDSPPFRQQVQNNIQCLVARARDSSLAHVKPTGHRNKQSDDLPSSAKDNIEFLDWLWQLCISNLHGGANFQRAKTCVDWIWLLLDGLIYQSTRKGRKAGCPEGTWRLLDRAQQHGWCLFFTPNNTHTLLASLLNGADEIREVALKILIQFFPRPLPLHDLTLDENESDDSSRCQAQLLLDAATQLCNSCLARECQAGALICQLLFQMYTLEGTHLNPSGIYPGNTHLDACYGFMDALVSKIETSITLAETNVLEAAKYSPGHGFILACQRCLQVDGAKWDSSSMQPITDRLMRSLSNLIDIVLHVFGGSQESGETAPSFEQIGVSIQHVISRGTSGSDSDKEKDADVDNDCTQEEDATVLSTQYKLINTWCWLNIKELSVLLAHIVILTTPIHHASIDTNDMKRTQAVGQLFIKILTKCRHRGAIEGCNVGFSLYCSHLLRSPISQLHAIPHTLLTQVLRQVTELSVSSVTRRSAGLPLIVQSIVASESKTKQVLLLEEAVVGMLRVLQQPVTSDPNQRQDLPQVHAMNILRGVFREAAVGHAVIPFLEEACRYTIAGFASPYWAIRNASTQLYGALVSRMLGQKKTREDGLNTTTAPEFFTLFPSLRGFLLEHVVNAAESVHQGTFHLHPCLVPVLSILAKLGPGVETNDATSLMAEYCDPIRCLAASPVHTVRRLAALSLTPLVPYPDMTQFIVMLLESLASGEGSMNRIHGTLLQVQMLLLSLKSRHSLHGGSLSAINSALEKASPLFEDNPCPLVKAVFIELITMATLDVDIPASDRLNEVMKQVVADVMSGVQETGVQIGKDQIVTAGVKWWLTSPSKDSPMSKITRCLQHPENEVQLAALHWLSSALTHNPPERLSSILNTMVQMVLKSDTDRHTHIPTLEMLGKVLNRTENNSICSGDQDEISVLQCIMGRIEMEASNYVKVLWARLAVPVLHGLVEQELTEKSRSMISGWCDLMVTFCDPGQADHIRGLAAETLASLGRGIWQEKWTCSTDILGSLVSATLLLLQDENSLCRSVAAATVAMVTDAEADTLQHEVAIQALLRKVTPRLCSYQAGLQLLCETINPCHRLQDALNDLQQDSWQAVFSAQEANSYGELAMLASTAVTAVKTEVTRKCLAFDDQAGLLSWINPRLNKSSSLFRDLQGMVSGGPLNLGCSKAGFDAMHSFLCEVDILAHITSCCHGDMTAICDIIRCVIPIMQEKQMNMHPALALKQQEIIKTYASQITIPMPTTQHDL